MKKVFLLSMVLLLNKKSFEQTTELGKSLSTIAANATNVTLAKPDMAAAGKRKRHDKLEGPQNKQANKKFTMVFLPDTQYYTAEPQGNAAKPGAYNIMFKSQTNWIANNRASRNIVYVGGLGDCVDHGDAYEVEWKRADTAYSMLENSRLTGIPGGIPYGVTVGNHDQSPNGSSTGTTNFYNKYFGIARFKGRTYYGGHYGSNNDNHYQLFTASNINFMVISLEYNLTSSFTSAGGALDWAEGLVKSNPGRKVIVLTHYTIGEDASFGPQGLAIYNRLKIYPNFFLLIGGHIDYGIGEARRADTYNGHTVHTILSDYQFHTNGGNGLLRIFTFEPQNNRISVQTYSPYTNTYLTGATSQFTLSINLSAANKTSEDSYPITKVERANTKQKPFNIYPNPAVTNNLTLFLGEDLKDEVLVQVFDITGKLQLSKTFANACGSVNLVHNLSSGTYTVIVKTKNETYYKKILVAH